MNQTYNIWMALSNQALTQFKLKRTAIRDETTYTGPMDDLTYKVLTHMHDTDTVQGFFRVPTLGGKKYNMFSLYVQGSVKLKEAIDEVTERWPDHLVVVGAWHFDGRQAGTQFTYTAPDEDGNTEINGVQGTPLYPIPSNAFRLMPPTIVYAEDGTILSSTLATTNAGLKDINLLSGQSPRRFT